MILKTKNSIFDCVLRAYILNLFCKKLSKSPKISLLHKLSKSIYNKALQFYSDDMSNKITNTTEKLKLMDCQETAELLRIDIKTLYAWMSRKQIPSDLYRKLGRKPVFIYAEVEKWFLAGAEVKKRNQIKEVKNIQTNSNEIKDITKGQQNCSVVNELHWTKIQQKEGG